jgi:MFS family permease
MHTAMFTKLFRQDDIPTQYRSNFLHFYLDIAWFGVLSGSAINFLNIYATRIGASGFQIGLIGAMSAIVNLFLAIPAARWLEKQNISRAIFWTAVFYRAGFIPLIFMPMLFSEEKQVVAIIILTFLMAIPLTPLGVGFNALFAEAVPSQYRAHVAGMRNVMLASTFMLTSLISGTILKEASFPIGYQIVFGIGTFGAAMSSFHLYFIKPLQRDSRDQSEEKRTLPAPPKPDPGKEASSPRNILASLRFDVWKTQFRNILLTFFAFHFTQYLAVPIFPLYNVRVLKLNDDHIGIGTALFYFTVLIGSTQLSKIAHKFGNKKLTGWSVAGLAVYPFLLSISTEIWHFYGLSLIGGLNFAMVSGTYANHMLEHIPAHDRPSHLAWYNLILNAAVLLGSLSGPAIADQMGLSSALMLIALLRFLSGLSILKWG